MPDHLLRARNHHYNGERASPLSGAAAAKHHHHHNHHRASSSAAGAARASSAAASSTGTAAVAATHHLSAKAMSSGRHRLSPATTGGGGSAKARLGENKPPGSSAGAKKASVPASGSNKPAATTKKLKNKKNNKHNSIVPDVVEERHRGSDKVDFYDKGKYLGKGGFARCYTLTSQTTGHVYAGKVVAKSSLKKEKAQQKLVAEIKIHQHLHHPNVVRFFHSFQDRHNVYILLELCSNQSLMELMKRRKRLTEPEVRYYMLQILEAVQYLHRHNVIHRDLKLGNLFLNSNLQVKLGDMGLSTKLDNADERKKTICGTPNYIAPEVISGGTHSFEVDIWSIGVILFTMLVGKPPFETRDVKATYKRIRRGSYTFPDTVQLSRDARLLIESLLQLAPEKRPSLAQIRNHSFFTRPGAFTPRVMPVSALKTPPSFATPATRRALDDGGGIKPPPAAPPSRAWPPETCRARLDRRHVGSDGGAPRRHRHRRLRP